MAKRLKRVKSELEEIPSVGLSIAADLISMGITRVAQLKGRSPEAQFKNLCDITGGGIRIRACSTLFAAPCITPLIPSTIRKN